MTPKLKKRLYKIILTTILLGFAVFVWEDYLPQMGQFMMYLIIYFIISNDIIQKAFQNLRIGEVFDENFLMLIASVGAFFIGEYHEGIAVVLLYQIGELFEGIAVQRSKKSINSLLDLQQVEVHLQKNNEIVNELPENVPVNSEIVVFTGERIPLDAKLNSSSAELDLSALTGESVPVNVHQGETVASGAINLGDKITLTTSAKYQDSTMTKMMHLVEEATSKKASSEQFITKFAKYYTPVVVILALLLAIVPLFFTGFNTWQIWLYRALIFLVISCPCALVISVPLSFFAGIGGLSKRGILVKGNEYLEQLTKVGAVMLDKTGTLTSGKFQVTNIVTETDQNQLLQIVASIEQYSTHPIAKSIVKANKQALVNVDDVQEVSGHGMQATYQGATYLVGNAKLMAQYDVQIPTIDVFGTYIYVAKNNQYLGTIVVADPIKDTAMQAMIDLQKMHIKRFMVTGDVEQVAANVSQKLQLDGYTSQCLPADKVQRVEQVMQEEAPRKVIFAGDGLNDAPVIARADIGFAMGGVGSDVAIEAADVVIMDDNPEKIVDSIAAAKKIMRIVKENISFALIVKFGFLLLATLGLTTMEWAIFADVGVTIIAVVNAIRALHI